MDIEKEMEKNVMNCVGKRKYEKKHRFFLHRFSQFRLTLDISTLRLRLSLKIAPNINPTNHGEYRKCVG